MTSSADVVAAAAVTGRSVPAPARTTSSTAAGGARESFVVDMMDPDVGRAELRWWCRCDMMADIERFFWRWCRLRRDNTDR